MAAANADMAANINSSLIQSVQTTTALATCLGVSLLVCAPVHAGMKLHYNLHETL